MADNFEQLNSVENEHERDELEFKEDTDEKVFKKVLLEEGLSEAEAGECIELAKNMKSADRIVFGEEENAPVFFNFSRENSRVPASYGPAEDAYFVNTKCYQADTRESTDFPHSYEDGLIGGYLDINEEEFYSKIDDFELKRLAIHELRHRIQAHFEDKEDEDKIELFEPDKPFEDEVTDDLYQTAYRFKEYVKEREARDSKEQESDEEKSIHEFDAQIVDMVALMRMYKGESFENIVKKMAENK